MLAYPLGAVKKEGPWSALVSKAGLTRSRGGHPSGCTDPEIPLGQRISIARGRHAPKSLAESPAQVAERNDRMTTSKKDASKASKLLSSPKTSKTVKSVAGSDLAQAKHKGGSKKK